MDFIRVTLYEDLKKAVKMSNRKKYENYLLSTNAIKSIAPTLNSDSGNTYHIYVANGFEPTGILFEVGSIEAVLPKSIIRILNQ
jgi:hypothetical protein